MSFQRQLSPDYEQTRTCDKTNLSHTQPTAQ